MGDASTGGAFVDEATQSLVVWWIFGVHPPISGLSTLTIPRAYHFGIGYGIRVYFAGGAIDLRTTPTYRQLKMLLR
jgi:hypothetical protein